MNDSTIDIRAYYAPELDSIRIYARHQITTGPSKMRVGLPIEYTEQDAGSVISPFLNITRGEAQVLANSLWDAGIRAVQGAGSAGQAAAMQAHIDSLKMELARASQIQMTLMKLYAPKATEEGTVTA